MILAELLEMTCKILEAFEVLRQIVKHFGILRGGALLIVAEVMPRTLCPLQVLHPCISF